MQCHRANGSSVALTLCPLCLCVCQPRGVKRPFALLFHFFSVCSLIAIPCLPKSCLSSLSLSQHLVPFFVCAVILQVMGTPGSHLHCLIHSFQPVYQKNTPLVLDLRALEHAPAKERHKQRFSSVSQEGAKWTYFTFRI